jgi:hypothetical protein
MNDPTGWESILDEGENILWQGRPDARLVWKISYIFTFIFGMIFAGFALFWMVMASQAGGGFWMFGLIHFSVGLGIAVGPPFWSAFSRRHTWYTLSDRRAFIATDKPFVGRRLKSYPITDDTVIGFEPGTTATIHFASERRRSKNGSHTVPIGFERIPDGEDVYAKIRAIQRAAE